MSVNSRSTSRKSGKTGSILGWAFGALLIMAVMTYLITVLLAAASGEVGFLNAHEHPRLTGLLRSAIPAAGLLAAGAAGAVGILRQRSLEAAYDLDRDRHDLDRDRHTLDQARIDAEAVARLRDRYTAVAAQLGGESVAVRLAGVYAAAALADDWLARDERSEAQVCIDLLCAYFRVPPPPGATEQGSPAEQEVRQTITRVISSHLQNPEDELSWCGMSLDFTGATFAGRHSFERARFNGERVSFTGAQFTGGTVSFTGAQFTGRTVSFRDALFAGTDVNFIGAVFAAGDVVFVGAEFIAGDVSFVSTTFARGRVGFEGTQFIGGSVSFTMAQVNGGRMGFGGASFILGNVSFEGAHFNGGTIRFPQAKFAGGSMSFAEARFTGGVVSFVGAQFAGGTVSFDRANVATSIPGPWGTQIPPNRYPSLVTEMLPFELDDADFRS